MCLRGGKIARRDGEDHTSVLSDVSNDSEKAEWSDEDELEATTLKNDAIYQNALEAIQTTAREALAEYPRQLACVDKFLTQTMHSQRVGGPAAPGKRHRASSVQHVGDLLLQKRGRRHLLFK